MKKLLTSLLLLLLTLGASAHVWEIRVNQSQNGNLTWYLVSYHGVSECGIGTSGLTINGVNYPITAIFAGDAATQSQTVFATNPSYSSNRPGNALSYGTFTTPFLGTTLSVFPYSNNVCWASLVTGTGTFTPPPPPVCTTCPVTGWSNTTGVATNNGTFCNPTDDVLAATVTVNHLSCASITGDGKFNVVVDPTGANVSYGPFNYTTGITTSVAVNLPYGTSNATQIQVIDGDFPCAITHGVSVPGGQFNGVGDNVPPTVSCPANITLNTNPGQCGAIANFSATANDNCGSATVTYSKTPGTLFAVGTTTVTATAKDAANNISSCNFTVTVVDNQLPTVNCPANVTVACNAPTNVAATGTASANDACGIASITYADASTQNSNVNNTGYYNYTISRTWTAKDNNNNSASCVQTITVKDLAAPTALAQNLTVNLSAAGSVTVNASDINNGSFDACSPVTVGLQGTTTTTGTVCGSANENGTLVLTAPTGAVITGITFASYGTPNGSCGNYTIGGCHAPNSASIVSGYAVGQNSVAIPANNGVFGDPCYGTVKRLYVQATYTAQVPTTVSSLSFDCSKVGANTVTLIAKDVTGNTSTANAVITVVDNITPVVATQNITVQLDANGGVSVAAGDVNAGSTDACGIQSMTVSPNSFTCGNIGANNVTLTVTDVNGNVSTGAAVVTVEDVTAPSINVPSNATVSCDGSTSIAANGTATAADNCGSVTITSSDVSTQDANVNAAGHYNYTVSRTWTATDASGNFTTGVQVITVEDATAPSIVVPANATVSCDGSTSIAANGTATGTDNCSSVIISSTDASTQDANVNNAGHYNYVITRTWSATDVTGNVTTSVQTITVKDVTAPSVTCPANTSASCNTTTAANGTATGTDNCSPVAISSTDASTKATSGPGMYDYTITRTWKATDVSGNATTCNQVITVSELRGAAIAVTPVNTINSNHPNYTIYLGYGPQSVTLAASVQGGIGAKTYSWSPSATVASPNSATTSVSPTTTTTYTVTITDTKGCSVQKSFTVYVVDVRCGNKVQICHFPPGNPGNPQQQCLPVSAIAAHLAHGCVLGACPQSKNSNVEEETPALTELSTEGILVYPNPNNGIFTVEIPVSMGKSDVMVMDMSGKVIAKKVIEVGNKIQVDLGGVSAGVYMINVTNGETHFRSRVSVK